MRKIVLIKRNEGRKIEISKTYEVTDFLTKDICKSVSVALGKASDHEETTRNIKSDRIYFVLEGKLTVRDENGKVFIARRGDIVFIPKNTKYHFKGTFKALLINSPAFDPKYEKIEKIKE